jgi:hypothetical protein
MEIHRGFQKSSKAVSAGGPSYYGKRQESKHPNCFAGLGGDSSKGDRGWNTVSNPHVQRFAQICDWEIDGKEECITLIITDSSPFCGLLWVMFLEMEFRKEGTLFPSELVGLTASSLSSG